MAKSQEDGITILLGLKDYKVEQVREDEDKVVVKVMLELRNSFRVAMWSCQCLCSGSSFHIWQIGFSQRLT